MILIKMMLPSPNEWQYKDESNGMIYPWFTLPFLRELSKWDLKGKDILEFGSGYSTLWFVDKLANITSFETNELWYRMVKTELTANFSDDEHNLLWQLILVSEYKKLSDFESIFDIIIIDGVDRDNCLKTYIDLLRPGGILIIDNWMQPSVWMPNEETLYILKYYTCNVYKQPNHPDWQTAVFIKPDDKKLQAFILNECIDTTE